MHVCVCTHLQSCTREFVHPCVTVCVCVRDGGSGGVGWQEEPMMGVWQCACIVHPYALTCSHHTSCLGQGKSWAARSVVFCSGRLMRKISGCLQGRRGGACVCVRARARACVREGEIVVHLCKTGLQSWHCPPTASPQRRNLRYACPHLSPITRPPIHHPT